MIGRVILAVACVIATLAFFGCQLDKYYELIPTGGQNEIGNEKNLDNDFELRYLGNQLSFESSWQ